MQAHWFSSLGPPVCRCQEIHLTEIDKLIYMHKLQGHVRHCPIAGDMARGYVYVKIEYVRIFQKIEYTNDTFRLLT